jgi:hypothetical protein
MNPISRRPRPTHRATRLLAGPALVLALAACDFGGGAAERQDEGVTVRPSVVIDGLVELSARTEGRLFVDEVVFHAPNVDLRTGEHHISDLLASDPTDTSPLLFRYDLAAPQGEALAGERRWNLSPAGATPDAQVVFGFSPLDASRTELDELSTRYGDLGALNGYTAYVHGYVALDDSRPLITGFSSGNGPSAPGMQSGDPEGDPTGSGDPEGDPTENAQSGDPEGDPTENAQSGDPEGDPTAESGDPEGDPTAESGDPEGDPTAENAQSGDPEGDPTAESGDPEGDPTAEADPEGDPAAGDPEPDPMDSDELSAASSNRLDGTPYLGRGPTLRDRDSLVPFLIVVKDPMQLNLPLPQLDLLSLTEGALPMQMHVDANLLFDDDRLADLDDEALLVVRGESEGVFVELGADDADAAFDLKAEGALTSRTTTRASDRSLNVEGDGRDKR